MPINPKEVQWDDEPLNKPKDILKNEIQWDDEPFSVADTKEKATPAEKYPVVQWAQDKSVQLYFSREETDYEEPLGSMAEEVGGGIAREIGAGTRKMFDPLLEQRFDPTEALVQTVGGLSHGIVGFFASILGTLQNELEQYGATGKIDFEEAKRAGELQAKLTSDVMATFMPGQEITDPLAHVLLSMLGSIPTGIRAAGDVLAQIFDSDKARNFVKTLFHNIDKELAKTGRGIEEFTPDLVNDILATTSKTMGWAGEIAAYGKIIGLKGKVAKARAVLKSEPSIPTEITLRKVALKEAIKEPKKPFERIKAVEEKLRVKTRGKAKLEKVITEKRKTEIEKKVKAEEELKAKVEAKKEWRAIKPREAPEVLLKARGRIAPKIKVEIPKKKPTPKMKELPPHHDYLNVILSEVKEGEFFLLPVIEGGKERISTYPDFMKKKGWTGKEVTRAIENELSGKELGKRQQEIVDAALTDAKLRYEYDKDITTAWDTYVKEKKDYGINETDAKRTFQKEIADEITKEKEFADIEREAIQTEINAVFKEIIKPEIAKEKPEKAKPTPKKKKISKELPKSKGHVGFIGKWEYFYNEKGNLYRAPKENYIDIYGVRVGARFESTPAGADAVLQLAGLKAKPISKGKPLLAIKDKLTGKIHKAIEGETIHADMLSRMEELGVKPENIESGFITSKGEWYSTYAKMREPVITKEPRAGEGRIAPGAKGIRAAIDILKSEEGSIEIRRRMKEKGEAPKKDIQDYKIGGITKRRKLPFKDSKGKNAYAPEIHVREEAVIKNMNELRPKPLGGWIENPTRTFEELGDRVKDIFYWPVKEGEYKEAVANKALDGRIKMLSKGISQKSMKRIGAYGISLQKRGVGILKRMGVEIPELTTKEMDVYHSIRGMFEDYYKLINEARDLSGKQPMGKIENYFTFMRDMTRLEEWGFNQVLDPKENLDAAFLKLKTTPFRFAKLRAKVGYIPLELHATDILKRYGRLANRHVFISPAIARGREYLLTFGSKKEGTAWKLKDYKPSAHNFLTRWLNFQAGQIEPSFGGYAKIVEKGLMKLNKNLAFSILSGNVRSAAIQVSALRNTVLEIGPRYTAIGVASVISPTRRQIAMKMSQHLLTRDFDIAYTDAFRAIQAGRIGRAKQLTGAALLKPLQLLDIETARATWYGAYRKGLEVHNMTERLAARYADDVVIRTQASAARSDIAPIQRTALGKSLALFQTFVINEWGFLTRDVLGIRNAEITSKAMVANAMRIIIYTTLFNSFFEDVLHVNSPFPAPVNAIMDAIEDGKDTKEALYIAAKELAEQMPLVGGGLRYGKGVGGAALETISEALRKRQSVKERLEAGAKVVIGIPGTTQVMKTLRARKRGESLYGQILGVYTPKKKRKKMFKRMF